MNVGNSVRLAINSFEDGELDSSVLHACNAVDGTAGKVMGRTMGNRDRFTKLLRDHYWLMEPTAIPGINLVETRFTNVPLPGCGDPDFADIVYRIHRCTHGHGDELPGGFELTPCPLVGVTRITLADGRLHLPDRLVFGLLFVAVLHPVNRGESVPGSYYLTLEKETFPINDWWGRADDFRPIAARYTTVREKLQW